MYSLLNEYFRLFIADDHDTEYEYEGSDNEEEEDVNLSGEPR